MELINGIVIMFSSVHTVLLSRVVTPLLGLLLWSFCVLEARCAYRFPERKLRRGLMVLGIFGVFILQMNLMDRLAPGDSRGIYFHCFILIEGGGALILLFSTLFREKARSKRIAARSSSAENQEL